jgi:transposase-like protein
MQKERGGQRRRRWSDAEKREWLSRWKASGMSAGSFASKEGMRAGNLWRWQREAPSSGAAGERASITFAPVQMRSEVQMPRHTADRSLCFEVILASGVRVRVPESADVSAATRLVLALSRGAAC